MRNSVHILVVGLLLLLKFSTVTLAQNSPTRPRLLSTCSFYEIFREGDRFVFHPENGGSISILVNKLAANKKAEFTLFYDTDKSDTFSLQLDPAKPMPIAVHNHKAFYFVWQAGNKNQSEIMLCEQLDTLTQAKIALSELNVVPKESIILFETPYKGKGCALSPSITVPINTAKKKLEVLGYEAVWNKKTGYYSFKKIKAI